MYKNFADDYVIACVTANVGAAVALVAFGHTAPNIAKAHTAIITVNSNGIQAKFNGDVPAANDGHAIAAGASWSVEGVDMVRNLKMIKAGGSAAAVTISLVGNKATNNVPERV